jgi:hypothetical protein
VRFSWGTWQLPTVFLVVEEMPYVSITLVRLPDQRPAAELVAERARILCERMEKEAVRAQRNDLSACFLS